MTTCIRPAHVISGLLQFPFFYHMTHKDNLAAILQHGILSHTDVLVRDDILATDISDAGVQQRRCDREDPVYHRALHDYAPLYINPKNPMLSKLRCRQHEIVILKISPGVLQGNEYVFSDGNAASRETMFSPSANVVSSSVEVLSAKVWKDYIDGTRRRCAELLVYPGVQPNHILSVICNSNAFAREIAVQTDIQIEVNPSMFF